MVATIIGCTEIWTRPESESSDLNHTASFHLQPSCTRLVSLDGKISLARFQLWVKFEYFIYVRFVVQQLSS